jgi:dimethylhistidine N-methyltransferase
MPALAERIAPLPPARPLFSVFADDVIAGLAAQPKRIPPKYFYDDEGSRLFEVITQLPEYYPTRSELEILSAHAADIAAFIPQNAILVEFGSGSCRKVRLLLDAAPHLRAYVPVDISSGFLDGQAAMLRRDYRGLAVAPVAADFTQNFALPQHLQAGPCVGFFPGSTIGNFEPHEATDFLRHAAAMLGPGASFIVGADLVKAPDVLNAAYNDAAGVTRQFNLNLLARINRELDADFDLDRFDHCAFYDGTRRRIEMHLVSLAAQTVSVAGFQVPFRAGETIHTENSYKFTPESFATLARRAGWMVRAMWTDAERRFAVYALALA